MNRFVHPGPPVWMKRLKNLFRVEDVNVVEGQKNAKAKKDARLGHQAPKLVRLKVDGIAEGANTALPHSPRVCHVEFVQPVVHVE